MIQSDQLIEKLKECIDPELGLNIVDLGLIYSVSSQDDFVNVVMTLTSLGCPLDSYFVKDITARLKTLKGVKDVNVEFTFEPPWTPEKMSQESKDILGFVN